MDNRAAVRSTVSTCTSGIPRSVSQRAQGSVVGASLHPVALVNVEVLGTNGCLVATDHRGPRPLPGLSYSRESRSPPHVRRARKVMDPSCHRNDPHIESIHTQALLMAWSLPV